MNRMMHIIAAGIALSAAVAVADTTTLTWNGADGAQWDSTTESNWLNGETPSVWVDGANVIFTNDATVSLGGAVSAASIIASNALTVTGITTAQFQESQGFVPKDSPALVFPGLALGDMAAVTAKMAGGSVSADAAGAVYHLVVNGTVATGQFQCKIGTNLLCVKVEFSEESDGIHARAVSAYSFSNGIVGCDIDSVGAVSVDIATSRDMDGYGLIDLKATSSHLVVYGSTSFLGALSMRGVPVVVTGPVSHSWSSAVSCSDGASLTVKGFNPLANKTFGGSDDWLKNSSRTLNNMVLANLTPVSAIMRGTGIGYDGSASVHFVRFNGQVMTFQLHHRSPYSGQYWIKGALVEITQNGASLTIKHKDHYYYEYSSAAECKVGFDMEANPKRNSYWYGIKSITMKTATVPSLTLGGNNAVGGVDVDNAILVVAAPSAMPADIHAYSKSLVVYGSQMPYDSSTTTKGFGRSRRFDSGSFFLPQQGLATEAKGYFVFDASTYYNRQWHSDSQDGNNYICQLDLKNGSKVEGNALRCGYYGISAQNHYRSSGNAANAINTGIDMLKTGSGRTTLVFTTDADLAVTGKIWDNSNNTGADIVKRGSETLTLSGANTFAGRLTVEKGTLALGRNNTLPASAPLTLAAGTVVSCGATTNSTGVLTLSGSASITLGDGTIAFADSSSATWANGAVLSITGPAQFPPQRVRFGTNASGLSFMQKKHVFYNGLPISLDNEGYLEKQHGFIFMLR